MGVVRKAGTGGDAKHAGGLEVQRKVRNGKGRGSDHTSIHDQVGGQGGGGDGTPQG